MAIRQLKPYLKNIADAIREKTTDAVNLLDFKTARNRDGYTDGVITFTDTGLTYEGNYWFSYDINLESGKTYIFNAEYENTNGIVPSWYLIYADGTRYGVHIGNPIEATKDVVRIDIFIAVGSNGSNNSTLTLNNLMLEEIVPFGINAQDFPNKIAEVYDKGVLDRDELIYNMVTYNGTRIHYHYAFQYSNWNGYEFIRPIKPRGYIANMFNSCYDMTSLPTPLDFSEIFTADGYTNDTSVYRQTVFAYCKNLEFIPDLNMKAIDGIEQWFRQCYKLHTIELLRVKRETIYTNTFAQCEKLTNITFEGEIGHHISFKDSPLLSVESQINIIKHLVDFSGTSDAGTYTVTFHADAWTILEASEKSPQSEGIEFTGTWREYVSSLGWNT